MEKLIQYTGGIIVVEMIIALLAICGMLIHIISTLKKSKILKISKTNMLITITSIIVISIWVGGFVGYYICLYKFI